MSDLSPRQRDVLEWCARGKTAEVIGTILGCSYATARRHRDLAIIKMDASNTTHAVAKAIEAGLIHL